MRPKAPTPTHLFEAALCAGCSERHPPAMACERLAELSAQGRPKDSACNCAVWPCSCACHGEAAAPP